MKSLVKKIAVIAVLATAAVPALAQSSALDFVMTLMSGKDMGNGMKMNSNVANAFFKLDTRSTEEFMSMHNALSDGDKAIAKAMCTGVDLANAQMGDRVTAMCRAAGY